MEQQHAEAIAIVNQRAASEKQQLHASIQMMHQEYAELQTEKVNSICKIRGFATWNLNSKLSTSNHQVNPTRIPVVQTSPPNQAPSRAMVAMVHQRELLKSANNYTNSNKAMRSKPIDVKVLERIVRPGFQPEFKWQLLQSTARCLIK